MSNVEFERAKAYSDIYLGNRTLTAQWERGDYKSAEESFLRINRQGQPLGNWESLLIEYRNSSYARTVMCVASGGESGHYWPRPVDGQERLDEKVESFHPRCRDIYDKLFIPSFESPVDDLTVPLMVAPEYFQKHKYLLEVVPLLTEREVAEGEENQKDILERDNNSDRKNIIENGEKIISKIEDRLNHISGDTSNPKTMSLVPLFYWYNHKGKYKRGLLYGFLYWLLSGSEEDIFRRKVNFSSIREYFEVIIYEYKAEISDYERSIGAGLKSTKKMGQFYDDMTSLLLNNSFDLEDEDFEEDLLDIMDRSQRKKLKTSKKSRTASRRDKNEVNIRELFKSSMKFHICGGIVDIKSDVHYDHVEKYSNSGETSPDNLKPTHPFCNNNRDKIESIKEGMKDVKMPEYYSQSSSQSGIGQQRSLFDQEEFPN